VDGWKPLEQLTHREFMALYRRDDLSPQFRAELDREAERRFRELEDFFSRHPEAKSARFEHGESG
jgi:hypothetical protein